MDKLGFERGAERLRWARCSGSKQHDWEVEPFCPCICCLLLYCAARRWRKQARPSGGKHEGQGREGKEAERERERKCKRVDGRSGRRVNKDLTGRDGTGN